MKSSLLTFFILLTLFKPVFSEEDPCRKSTEGTDFWFGFMESRHYQSGHYTEITLTSIYDCNIEITIGNVPFQKGVVQKNIPLQIKIPWSMVEPIGSEKIENMAIHLVSDKPLNLYALNWSPKSADVALIFPRESLGMKYYAVCYTPTINNYNPKTKNASSKNSEFLIVASEDETTVWITPHELTDGSKPAGKPFNITLNRGEMYQVQSETLDLTGSYIESDKPVAFFSGSYSASIPANVCCYDHLYEQIPPLQAWGREFLAVPIKTRAKDYYRVLASENNTTVRIGYNILPLNQGEFHEFELNADQTSFIESDKPILLVQYCASNDVDRPPGVSQDDWDGDPFMVVVSPVNQTREKVAFVAYHSTQIDNYFINVVVRDDAAESIILDNSKVKFTKYAGTEYSYAQVSISKGNHMIESIEPGKGFIAYVYGFGGVESYGYGVGYNLDIVLDLGGQRDAEGRKFIVRCEGTDPITLNAGNAFDTFLWSHGETTSSIQVTEEGTYSVKATIKNGCELKDTIKILLSKPDVDLGIDRTVCIPETITIDPDPDGIFKDFVWTTPQGTLTDKKITISKPGDYSVIATTTFGSCTAGDDLKVIFEEPSKINPFLLDTLICGKKSIPINITANKGVYTLERADTNEKMQGLNAVVPVYGSFPFKFTATDQYGCATDTSFKLGFHKIPTIVLSIDSTTCYHYNLTANYKGDAQSDVSRFTWVFAGDTIADGIGKDSDTIPLGTNQSKRDLSLRVIQDGCANADTIKDIKVIPNLSFQVVDSLGCQPFSTEFIAHNSEKVFYDWNFGDGIIRRLSDHPSWTYEKDGYYDVNLKVTTDKGCTNSVKIDSAVYVAPIPTAGFSQDPKECLDLNNHQLSYFGTGDQKDSYNWDLSAFDQEEIIQNPRDTQGPFIFNLKNKPLAPVRISVISKYLCKSDTAKVMVSRIPSFVTNVTDNKGCTPLQTSFQGIQVDPVDQITYKWDFGDGTSAPGSNVSHFYDSPDHWYNIKVTALSSLTGCSSDFMKDSMIFAYPKPKSEFAIDHSIVYTDKPEVHFENQSLNATYYLWDFGESITSTDKDPSYKFKDHGYKKVLLEAFNDFECSDTISQNVLVAFSQIFPPNAFSPNAPNAQDREFKLSQEAIRQEGYRLSIFSRWNDIIFETKNEIKGWDGKLKNGDYAPAGSYVWKLDFFDFHGRKHQQSGTVTLLY